MADAIIIDDGGSTRIKQLKLTTASGRMDDLIEIAVVGGQSQSKDFALGPFSQVRMTCLDATGAPMPPLESSAPVPAGTFPLAMNVGDSIVVHSGKHRVQGKIVNRGAAPPPPAPPTTIADCEITVKAISGVEPIVDARHAKQQRRYVISNAPPIDTLDVNFTGSAPTRTFTVPGTAVYTVVILD
jgi:hypothetical protein